MGNVKSSTGQIDWKISGLIAELNALGIETFYSCSGHHRVKPLPDGTDLREATRLKVNGQICGNVAPYLSMRFTRVVAEILTRYETIAYDYHEGISITLHRYHGEKDQPLTIAVYSHWVDYYTPERFQLILRYLIFKLKRLKG